MSWLPGLLLAGVMTVVFPTMAGFETTQPQAELTADIAIEGKGVVSRGLPERLAYTPQRLIPSLAYL